MCALPDQKPSSSFRLQAAVRARDEPAKPRGPGLRTVQVAEPLLYSSCELSWSTAHGAQDVGSLVPKCPIALASNDSCAPCRVIRSGHETRHAVIGLRYSERISGIPRFRCQVHKRNFSLLTPAVYEALPEDTIVHPELVVLTEDSILRKEAWRVLGMKVLSSSCWPACSALRLMHLADYSCFPICAGLGLWRRFRKSGCSNCETSPGHLQRVGSTVWLLAALACA